MKKMLKRGFVGGGVLDAPQIDTHLPGNCRAACPQAAAEKSRPFPANPLKNGDAAINLRAGHARPLQGGELFLEGNKNYLSILHVSKLLVISPWISTDTRSTRAAGSSFMPVRTHSSVRPTKAYL